MGVVSAEGEVGGRLRPDRPERYFNRALIALRLGLKPPLYFSFARSNLVIRSFTSLSR